MLDTESIRLRKEIIKLAYTSGEAHIPSALSSVEILRFIFDNLEDDDVFIYGKGHGCLGYYVMLRERGFDPQLMGCTHRDPDNGIYCHAGSLGHCLPIAVGAALSRKIFNVGGRIFLLIGDGECQEGTTWESMLVASHHNLNNLVVFIDNNKLQSLDFVENICSLGDLSSKFVAFGASVVRVNGNNFNELQRLSLETNNPLVIICNTTKGLGVSFMENKPEWHARKSSDEEIDMAMKELDSYEKRVRAGII